MAASGSPATPPTRASSVVNAAPSSDGTTIISGAPDPWVPIVYVAPDVRCMRTNAGSSHPAAYRLRAMVRCGLVGNESPGRLQLGGLPYGGRLMTSTGLSYWSPQQPSPDPPYECGQLSV